MKEEEETMRAIALNYSILEKMSKEEIKSIVKIIVEGKDYLVQQAEIYEKYYPEDVHDIPSPDNLDIANYSQSAMTTNTCNQAIKSYRVMVDDMNKRD